jgi:hypothetical protein
MIGAATINSIVVSADAQPAGTFYCAIFLGQPTEQLAPCFPISIQRGRV